MEALLEAIFGNFMIVIVIIGAIISFLKDKTDKEKQKQQQSNTPYRKPNPKPVPSASDYQAKRNHPSPSVQKQTIPKPTSVDTKSIEEQQANQLKKLVDRIDTGSDQTLSGLQLEALNNYAQIGSQLKNKKSQHQPLQKRLKRNLSRDGLVDSVIMAEVLGPPRAVKSFRTDAKERRRN